MNNNIEVNEQYIKTSFEGEQKGVFFRSPIQKRYFDDYSRETYVYYRWHKYNPISWILNYNVMKNYPKWASGEEDRDGEFAGFTARVFTWPIYFTRTIRRCVYEFKEHSQIKKIEVFGEEPYKNDSVGSVIEEVSKFYFHNGSVKKIIKKDAFHYEYSHVVKEEFLKVNSVI